MPASAWLRPPVTLAILLGLALAGGACAARPGAGAPFAAAEERPTGAAVDDETVRIALNTVLLEDRPEWFRDVSTLVYQGRVLLVGSVPSAEARARAGALAHRPRGVKEVINDVVVRGQGGLGSAVDDGTIEAAIQTEYLFDQTIDPANVRVRSVNGTVYLIGLARSRAELDKALQVARTAPDVRAVVSHVGLRPPGG